MAVVDIGNVEWIELAPATGNEMTQTDDITEPINNTASQHSTTTVSRSMAIRVDAGQMILGSGTEMEGVRTLVIGFTPVRHLSPVDFSTSCINLQAAIPSLVGSNTENWAIFTPKDIKHPMSCSNCPLLGTPQSANSPNRRGERIYNPMDIALTDRYLAIDYPDWYREKMTVRLACTIIVIGTIVIVFFLKIDYVIRLGTLRCEDWLVHANVIGAILILLFISCVVLNAIVYLEVKIPQFETISPSDNSSNEDSVGWIELAPVEREESHRPIDVLSPVEVEATRTLIVAVTYFLSYQTVVIVSAFWACRFVFGELECANFKWLGPCVKELTLIPAFYGPLIFLMKNREIVTDEIGPV
ncbi:hypothetical protein DAPPUDRAFT_109999 [Daphnia pulex]|uniref:Uncharacterized protein n=1 Tax=Daphnia pulex TaxID=6669 RepID=E9H4W0_DAPPU|nr:hypothetical protein DAPPUDRAFT_109999 [Daphnia pulex]|eukprot:EFX73283.1 hypothetical protein DAPPUDRAFT_109999 [Daphnia pulex]